MLEHGVYLAPSQFEAGFTSLAHTDEDIEKTIAAARSVLLACNRMLVRCAVPCCRCFLLALLAGLSPSAGPCTCIHCAAPSPNLVFPAGACLRASEQALAAAASKQASEQTACERGGRTPRMTHEYASLSR